VKENKLRQTRYTTNKEAQLSLTNLLDASASVAPRAVILRTLRLIRAYSKGMQPKLPARSATIRYNRIANWKRKEIFGTCSYLELPCRTDGRSIRYDTITLHRNYIT